MKKMLFSRNRLLASCLVLCMLLLLPVPTTAYYFPPNEGTTTVVYGTADPSTPTMAFQKVTITGDPSLRPGYDPENYVYVFFNWSGEKDHIALLDDEYSEQTFFYMPTGEPSLKYAAVYVEFWLPSRPFIDTKQIKNGIYVEWTAPQNGDAEWVDHYVVEVVGYDDYVLPSAARSHRITNLTEGQTYTIKVYAVSTSNIKGKASEDYFVAGPYYAYFNPDNGTAEFKLPFDADEPVPRPADPVREGYEFLGWFHEWDNSIPADFNTIIYSSQFFIAVWQKKAPTPTPSPTPAPTPTPEPTPSPTPEPAARLTVLFDSQGGSEVPQQEVEKGESLSPPAEPSRTGYRFGGWFRDGRRFDFSQPINENLTLSAYWTADCPVYDPQQLIGEAGQLDGLLCQAIGLSGSYDAARFEASPGPLYPSVQLSLRDLPEAAVVFSNPVHLRHLEKDQVRLAYASRFDSESHFTPSCQAVAIDLQPASSEDSFDQQLTYTLRLADRDLLALDRIHHFAASDGLVHLRYPEAEEAYAQQAFTDLLAGISLSEGVRPAVSYASFDLRQTEQASTVQLLYTLTRLDHFLDGETADRRLNAEALEAANSVLSAELEKLAALAEATTDEGWWEDLATDAVDLADFGVRLERKTTEAGDSLTWQFLPGSFLAIYEEVLPQDYLSPLALLQEVETDLLTPNQELAADTWNSTLLALTRLALQIADCPRWTDPYWRIWEKDLVASFVSYLSASSQEGAVFADFGQAYDHYLEAAADWESRLPAGIFSQRIGPYYELVRSFQARLTELGRALTEEELQAFLQEANPLNRPAAKEGLSD